MAKPLKTFIIYARKDATFKDELTLQLQSLVRKNLIEKWDDSHLLPGEEWEKRILQELAASDLVIMLVSAHSLYSDFIQKKELKAALEQRHAGVTRVIPILVRDCLWEEEEDLAMLQMLPKAPNGSVIPVAAWGDKHSAWAAACRELIKLVTEISSRIAALAEIASREADEKAAAEIQVARQTAHAEKEKKNSQRLQQQDEAAWKTTLTEVAATEDIAEKIAVFEAYLEVETHTAHVEDADTQILQLKAAQHRLRIVAKKAEDARRLAAEKEVENARLAAIEAEKKQRPENGDTLRDAPELPEMVFVAGGTFQMGSNESDNEKPIHPVTLSDYYIGKYPVTFEEYEIFCTATKREKPTDNGWGRGKRPVIDVDHEDAIAYCAWVAQKTGKKYRLPTEAEWEFAASGGTLSKGFAFAGSNNLEEVGWYDKNSDDKKLAGNFVYGIIMANNGKTHPVGQKKANELGLFDMSGNVCEWCSDSYGDYASDRQLNPTGPTSGALRVYRGGSWIYDARDCRVSSRSHNTPSYRGKYIGFRLVLFALLVRG